MHSIHGERKRGRSRAPDATAPDATGGEVEADEAVAPADGNGDGAEIGSGPYGTQLSPS